MVLTPTPRPETTETAPPLHHVPDRMALNWRRFSRCGQAVTLIGHRVDRDGTHDEETGLPLGVGSSRLDYVTCPACRALVIGLVGKPVS